MEEEGREVDFAEPELERETDSWSLVLPKERREVSLLEAVGGRSLVLLRWGTVGLLMRKERVLRRTMDQARRERVL